MTVDRNVTTKHNLQTKTVMHDVVRQSMKMAKAKEVPIQTTDGNISTPTAVYTKKKFICNSKHKWRGGSW